MLSGKPVTPLYLKSSSPRLNDTWEISETFGKINNATTKRENKLLYDITTFRYKHELMEIFSFERRRHLLRIANSTFLKEIIDFSEGTNYVLKKPFYKLDWRMF